MNRRTALKVARIEVRLTQKDLALMIGVTQQTIAKWELGVTTPSHFKQFRRLESALNKPSAMLFPDVFSHPTASKPEPETV